VGLDPLGIPLGPFDTASLLLEKALDTLEDVALITKRQVNEVVNAVALRAQAQGGNTQALLDATRRTGTGTGAGMSTAVGALGAWQDASDVRPRLLVLGAGWAAHALIKVFGANWENGWALECSRSMRRLLEPRGGG
jgi:ornithine cyclodeaminase/alanine dehydrogenase-like protein (mu-crystallin family)